MSGKEAWNSSTSAAVLPVTVTSHPSAASARRSPGRSRSCPRSPAHVGRRIWRPSGPQCAQVAHCRLLSGQAPSAAHEGRIYTPVSVESTGPPVQLHMLNLLNFCSTRWFANRLTLAQDHGTMRFSSQRRGRGGFVDRKQVDRIHELLSGQDRRAAEALVRDRRRVEGRRAGWLLRSRRS